MSSKANACWDWNVAYYIAIFVQKFCNAACVHYMHKYCMCATNL